MGVCTSTPVTPAADFELVPPAARSVHFADVDEDFETKAKLKRVQITESLASVQSGRSSRFETGLYELRIEELTAAYSPPSIQPSRHRFSNPEDLLPTIATSAPGPAKRIAPSLDLPTSNPLPGYERTRRGSYAMQVTSPLAPTPLSNHKMARVLGDRAEGGVASGPLILKAERKQLAMWAPSPFTLKAEE